MSGRSGLELRDARSLDAGAVGALLSGFIDTTDWMPRVYSRAEDLAHAARMIERGWVRLACLDGRPVAFAAREASFVHALYVAPDAQNRGIGRALLEDAKREAAWLELWTFEANDGAQRFYEREGFDLAERTDGSDNDEGLPDRRYVWTAPSRARASAATTSDGAVHPSGKAPGNHPDTSERPRP